MLCHSLLAIFLAPGDGTTVLRSTTWIDVEATDAAAARRPRTSLVWRGDEILAIGPDAEVPVPEGAEVIDGRGAFLIPGLIDMHVHLAGAGDGTFEALVEHGVTGARDLGGELEELDAARERIERGELVGPRIARAGFMIEDARWLRVVRDDQERAAPGADRFLRTHLPVATEAQALEALGRVLDSGADLLKIRNAPPPAALRVLLREAALGDLPVAAHEPTTIDLVEAAALGLGSLEHPPIFGLLEGTTPEHWQAIARAFREHDVCVTPTLVAMQGRALDAEGLARALETRLAEAGDDLTAELREHWREQVAERARETGTLDWPDLFRRADDVLRTFHAEGVPFLAGTDLGVPLVLPGAGLHAELGLLVERIGLTPLEALRAATRDAAAWLRWPDLGVLRPGARADFVLLAADPLQDVANVATVRTVVARGVIVVPARAVRPEPIERARRWVGTVSMGERTLSYLLEVTGPPAARTASLDRLDQVLPASAAASVEETEDSLSVLFADPEGRPWALVLERVEGEGLAGVLEIGESGGATFPASFRSLAELAPAVLESRVGDYADEDGERLHVATIEEGLLVAHRARDDRFQMLFPATDARFLGGPGPTSGEPAVLEVRFDEQGLVWTEDGTTHAFQRIEVPRVEVGWSVDAITRGDLTLPLVHLSPGTFRMGQRGSTAEVLERLAIEASGRSGPEPDPVRPTTLTRPFWMARVETTRAWFEAFVDETGTMTDAERVGSALTWNGRSMERTPAVTWRRPGFASPPDAPVVFVSWNDARAFCGWLSARLDRTVRLPTEAEWEYACAAGTETLFSCGDALDGLDAHAWSTRNATGPRAVATRAANPWGLFDMHGNVWEWCRDAWAPFSAEPAVDPTGPDRGAHRVLRGGSWINGPFSLRTAYRGHDPATLAEPHIGFRIVVEDDRP